MDSTGGTKRVEGRSAHDEGGSGRKTVTTTTQKKARRGVGPDGGAGSMKNTAATSAAATSAAATNSIIQFVDERGNPTGPQMDVPTSITPCLLSRSHA